MLAAPDERNEREPGGQVDERPLRLEHALRSVERPERRERGPAGERQQRDKQQ